MYANGVSIWKPYIQGENLRPCLFLSHRMDPLEKEYSFAIGLFLSVVFCE